MLLWSTEQAEQINIIHLKAFLGGYINKHWGMLSLMCVCVLCFIGPLTETEPGLQTFNIHISLVKFARQIHMIWPFSKSETQRPTVRTLKANDDIPRYKLYKCFVMKSSCRTCPLLWSSFQTQYVTREQMYFTDCMVLIREMDWHSDSHVKLSLWMTGRNTGILGVLPSTPRKLAYLSEPGAVLFP